jgi:hypothetical protein
MAPPIPLVPLSVEDKLMRHIVRLAILATLALLLPSEVRADLSTFQAALSTHLDSIQRRDAAAFETTLTAGSSLTFVALDGSVTTSKEAFVKKTRGWLADPDWTWRLEQLSMTSGSHVGTAVFQVRYQDLDSNRKPYSLVYVLSLVFEKQGAEWRLVHDQNTRIDPN